MTNIRMPNGDVINGTNPIVIIGPNGVGKSRLGANIARQNNGQRIAALRQIALTNIPMQTIQQASDQARGAIQQALGETWRQSEELQYLMAEILEEHRRSAIDYRDSVIRHLKDGETPPHPPETRSDKIKKYWDKNFPGREVHIEHEPTVSRFINGNEIRYHTGSMSDGERTALYLIARIVSLKEPVVVVDEPETYFHPVLARQIWNELEALAPATRFIYITHDVPFALSRKNAQFVIARSDTTADILPLNTNIPNEIIQEVLGAASFAISASKIIFCEGEIGSCDHVVYSAWHDNSNTSVIPVGSCNNVVECVKVFRAGHATSNVEAYGYVDRDYWPESYFGTLTFVKPLHVHEIEGVFCHKEIFAAFAEYYRIPAKEIDEKYDRFLDSARNAFQALLLNKQILNRVRTRTNFELERLLNGVAPNADISDLREKYLNALDHSKWGFSPQNLYDEEVSRVCNALRGNVSEFLKIFPSKSFYSLVAKELGVTFDAMLRDFCAALKLTDEESLRDTRTKKLKDTILSSLSDHFWGRN